MTEVELRIWRSSLQEGTVLTLTQAAEALPAGDMGWIRQHVRAAGSIDGRAIYRWGDILQAAGITQRGPELYIDTKEASERLGVSTKTLSRRMGDTPEGKEIWTNIGTKDAPVYRWSAQKLGRWWEDVQRWRASTSLKTESTKSGGGRKSREEGSRTAQRRSRATGKQTGSSGRLRRDKPKEKADSLGQLAKRLNSQRSTGPT